MNIPKYSFNNSTLNTFIRHYCTFYFNTYKNKINWTWLLFNMIINNFHTEME